MNTLIRLLEKIREWQRYSESRRILLQLDDNMLKDIGLSRIDAQCESIRPFWDTAVNNDQSLKINTTRRPENPSIKREDKKRAIDPMVCKKQDCLSTIACQPSEYSGNPGDLSKTRNHREGSWLYRNIF